MAEAVSYPTPMICELCFCPVISIGYMSGRHAQALRERLQTLTTAVKVTHWPETLGLPVWFHSQCYRAALKERGR
jgi:hypothetical protein